VRFVDAEERRRDALEPRCCAARLERLGSREHDDATTLREPVERCATLGRAQTAMEQYDRDATALERVRLVRHERDERRDDDRRPVEEHRRHLVDERLAKARRKVHQRVARFEDGEHRRLLLGP
jgi:hypothetical protein